MFSFSKVSTFVQDALSQKTAVRHASEAVIWGSLNSLLLALLLYDLHYGGYTWENKLIWWFALLMCVVCGLNIFVHLKSYFITIFVLTPIEVNENQRKLLAVTESDVGFRSPSPEQRISTPIPDHSPKLSELFHATIHTPPPRALSTSNLASPNKSWYHSSPGVCQSFGSSNTSHYSNASLSPVLSVNQSLNASNTASSITVNSWSYHRNKSAVYDSTYSLISNPKRNILNSSQLAAESFLGKNTAAISPSSFFGSSLSSSPIHSPDRREPMTSKKELDVYLKEFHEKERKKRILSQTENTNGGSSSLWAYSGASPSSHDFSSLKQNVYQPATKDEGLEVNSSLGKIDDAKMTSYSSISVSKIWLRRKVTPKDLFKFEENLRIWFAMNILQPLVQLIDSCNEALMAVAPELKIGNVGVDKLKKAAQNISGVKQLNYLLPFLEVTLHQDYLVQRLRELSRGGAISAFQWNAGGSFKGKPWREEYSTDTFILLHLFSMYMDYYLPPDPTQPDGRVFSNVHVVRTPEKPATPTSHPYLYLTQINPPHLKVVLPPDEECEVGAGHKNFLHALILFCHHLVHQQHSHIAGVNLTLSGINLAWVVNAE